MSVVLPTTLPHKMTENQMSWMELKLLFYKEVHFGLVSSPNVTGSSSGLCGCSSCLQFTSQWLSLMVLTSFAGANVLKNNE